MKGMKNATFNLEILELQLKVNSDQYDKTRSVYVCVSAFGTKILPLSQNATSILERKD